MTPIPFDESEFDSLSDTSSVYTSNIIINCLESQVDDQQRKIDKLKIQISFLKMILKMRICDGLNNVIDYL